MACDWPITVQSKLGAYYQVPCGRCPPCKRARVQDWVFFLEYEDRRSVSSYFVTLTYDNANVPITENGFLTLYKKDPHPNKYIKIGDKKLINPDWDASYTKRDVPSFIKRLRKTQRSKDNKIKYFAVGEYGSKGKRPHYHIILFNVDTEVFPIGKDANGNMKYRSPTMEKCWPYGTVDIGSVSGDSVGYTAKYIDKVSRVPAFKGDDRQKEFSICSKGLGDNYLSEQILAYHRSDLSRNYVTLRGGVKQRLPRRFREKIYSELERHLQNKFIISAMQENHEKIVSDLQKAYGEDFDADAYLREVKISKLTAFNQKTKKRGN